MRPKLQACLLCEQPCTEPLEDRERFLERFSRCAFSLRAPLDCAENEERPATLERNRYPSMLGERLADGGERPVEVRPRREQQRATTPCGRESGRPVEPPRALLV